MTNDQLYVSLELREYTKIPAELNYREEQCAKACTWRPGENASILMAV